MHTSIKPYTMARKWKKYIKYKKAPEVEVDEIEGLHKSVLDLVIKKTIPITEQEKRLAKQIRQIKKRGNIVDLPLE